IRRHPVASYFCLAYLVPVVAFAAVVGPKLVRGEATRPTDALILFPIMELAVAISGIALTGVVDGRRGLRDLFARIGRWRVGARWYAALLLPPALLLAVLLALGSLLSPDFAPQLFPLGIAFGVVAGLFEETGWMGYAFPKLRAGRSALAAGILLGVLWGLWHAPVVDGLGAATPHGASWLPFFLAFIGVVAAMRVLIVWVYENTTSVLLAQLMHASSTVFLVVLSPVRVTPAQEALWYAIYGALLWIAVALVVATLGSRLVGKSTHGASERRPATLAGD